MKSLFKTLSICMLVLCGVLVVSQGVAYAGGSAGAICVQYVTYDEYGCSSSVDTSGQQLTQTVVGPDCEGETERWYDNNCFHYYIFWDEKIMHGAGTYTVTRADMPAGYELDVEMSKYLGMSYEVTQDDIDKYNEWRQEEAGTDEFVIEVPVKKIGEKSAIAKAPAKPKLCTSSDTCLYFEGVEWRLDRKAISYELTFSKTKTGTYKKLYKGSSDFVNMENLKAIKHKQTYYMKVRAIKKVVGLTVQGAWSSPKKIKVKKTDIDTFTPVIKVYPEMLFVSVDNYYSASCKIVYEAATSKKGKYKAVLTTNVTDPQYSEFKKLQKGKTYYFRVRIRVKIDGTYIYSKYSKSVKAKIQ